MVRLINKRAAATEVIKEVTQNLVIKLIFFVLHLLIVDKRGELLLIKETFL